MRLEKVTRCRPCTHTASRRRRAIAVASRPAAASTPACCPMPPSSSHHRELGDENSATSRALRPEPLRHALDPVALAAEELWRRCARPRHRGDHHLLSSLGVADLSLAVSSPRRRASSRSFLSGPICLIMSICETKSSKVNCPEHPLRVLLDLLLVGDDAVEVVDDADDVAHPEDARAIPSGRKGRADPAHARERRHPGDLADRQGGPAAASPSSMVSATPVSRGLVEGARWRRVLPDGALTTRRMFCGFVSGLDRLELPHERRVDGEAAGGVEDDGSFFCTFATARARRYTSTGVEPGTLKTGTRLFCPSTVSCSTAAGRWRSAATSSTFALGRVEPRELGAGGRLPWPWADHHHDGGRPLGASRSARTRRCRRPTSSR